MGWGGLDPRDELRRIGWERDELGRVGGKEMSWEGLGREG